MWSASPVEQIAVERGQDPHETFLDLIEEEDNHVGAVVPQQG